MLSEKLCVATHVPFYMIKAVSRQKGSLQTDDSARRDVVDLGRT